MTLRILLVCAVSTVEQAEKISIEQQRANGLAWTEQTGGRVVDIVEIPGYSRRFYTLRELAEQAARDGFSGPAQLERHIQDKDFDVLWTQVTNRFNREQSLNAEIIARVVRECRARIYSASDGMIDESNYRAYIAITGYRDASEIDELVRKRAMGILDVARRGLPVSSKVPMSHRLIRNPESGKAERLELRSDLQLMWRRLAELLLEGVPYGQLEEAMFTRFGYGDNGTAYYPGKFQKLLYSPAFWGNNVIRWHRKVAPHLQGAWAFDASAALPAGVDVFYATHEAVYTGALAEAVKAELKRRSEVFNGNAGANTKPLSALVYCAECQWRYGYNTTKNAHGTRYAYLRCNQAARANHLRYVCSQSKLVKESDAIAFLNDHITYWLEIGEVAIAAAPMPRLLDAQALHTELEKLERRRDNLLDAFGDASDDDTRLATRRRIQVASEQIARLRTELSAAQQESVKHRTQNEQQRITLALIQQIGLPAFWQRDGLFINQQLKSLLGDWRLVARDGEIVGFIPLSDLA